MKSFATVFSGCIIFLCFFLTPVKVNGQNDPKGLEKPKGLGNTWTAEQMKEIQKMQNNSQPAKETPAANDPQKTYRDNQRIKNAEEAAIKNREAERIKTFDQRVAKYSFVDAGRGKYSLCKVGLNGKYGYVNSYGTVVGEIKYDSVVLYFSEDLATVKLQNKWGYLDLGGRERIALKYDNAWAFVDGLAGVKLNGKYGFINKLDVMVIPFIYEDAKPPSYDLYAVKLNGKWGFIDKTGNTKIAFEYDDVITAFSVPPVIQVPKKNTVNDMYGSQSSTPALVYYEAPKPIAPTATVIKGNAKYKITKTALITGDMVDKVTGASLGNAMETSTFTDPRDNKTYKTIKIGDDVWMAENLNTELFTNGEKISEAASVEAWNKASKKHKAAWCYYDNNPERSIKYGRLYNFYTVVDIRGLAPAGWHIASDAEWSKLINLLGGEKNAGASMIMYSWSSYQNSVNPSGFSALPGGERYYYQKEWRFIGINYSASWWSNKEDYPGYGRLYNLSVPEVGISIAVPGTGHAIRCVKDH